MFNFYKYLFLFIMNLSLAVKIESCSVFSKKGDYILDEAYIGKNLFKDIIIEILEPAKSLSPVFEKEEIHIVYNIEGMFKYKENGENKKIKFNYCYDLISNDVDRKLKTVSLSDYNRELKEPSMPITITNSNMTYGKVKLTEPDDHAIKPDDSPKILTGSLYQDDNKETYGKKRSMEVESTGSQSIKKQKTLKFYDYSDELHGKKRSREDESKVSQSSIISKKFSGINGCDKLKNGIYKILDREDLYIKIISIKHKTITIGDKVEGFLIYEDFFSVPIYRCILVDENYVFSLSRTLRPTIVVTNGFLKSKPIDYQVPKNKFIDKNYIDRDLFPTLNYKSDHYNIGCSLLYKAFLNKKSTLTLKGNTIINISSLTVLTKKFSQIDTYGIKGTITIAGNEYSFEQCYREYDNENNENNDSQLICYTTKSHTLLNYQFNALDILPSLTP